MTKELYITTTETLYPGETRFERVVVRLYGRTAEGEQLSVTVRGFDPYFLAPAADSDDVPPAEYEDLLGYDEVDTDPLSERFDSAPESLVRVNCKYPHSVPNLRSEFDTTWGADCIFTERFRIDHDLKTGISVPEAAFQNGSATIQKEDVEPTTVKDVTPRVLTLDIETDDRDDGFPAPGETRILSIAVHDNYTDTYGCFIDLNQRQKATYLDVPLAEVEAGSLSISDIGITEPDAVEFCRTETLMLTAFGEYVQDTDPDLICGWNSGDSSVDGFDMPHIIKRMKRVGVTSERLSRENGVEVEERGDNYYTEIAGRALYDLMDGWADTKFTQPRSKKLDDVAEGALDDAKIAHQDQGYYEMYDEDPVKFINYNVKDTRLTVEINEEENVLGFKKRLKDMVGVDWRRTHQNNEFIEMSVRRKCFEHDLAMITAYDNEFVANSKGDGVNYEGAYVFPSFDGLKENVCGVDLASLYPMTQWMLNASPDTRIEVEKGTPEWYELKDEMDGQYVEAANGQMFRTDVDGIIRELVDDYHEVKREFKAERNAAEYGTDAWEEAAEAYNVTKTIYNSFYGYSGWDRSPLYNPYDAGAITLTCQRVIKRTAKYFEEQAVDGVEVVYGDTDSNYVEFPDAWDQERTLEYAMDCCDELTTEIYPKLCDEFHIPRDDNRWEIEVEMRAKRFLMSDSKKRYAYLKMWDEGDELDQKVNGGDGKFSVTGYECVKSNFSLLTKQTQEKVLEQIVRGDTKEGIVDTVYTAAASIDAKNPDWERIGIPQGLRQSLDRDNADGENCYSWSKSGDHPKGESPRAAWFANHIIETDFGKGDKPLRTKLRPTEVVGGESVDVIAFERSEQVADENLTIDVQETQRKTLENPLRDILDAVGIEIDAALQGKTQTQTGLESFA